MKWLDITLYYFVLMWHSSGQKPLNFDFVLVGTRLYIRYFGQLEGIFVELGSYILSWFRRQGYGDFVAFSFILCSLFLKNTQHLTIVLHVLNPVRLLQFAHLRITISFMLSISGIYMCKPVFGYWFSSINICFLVPNDNNLAQVFLINLHVSHLSYFHWLRHPRRLFEVWWSHLVE